MACWPASSSHEVWPLEPLPSVGSSAAVAAVGCLAAASGGASAAELARETWVLCRWGQPRHEDQIKGGRVVHVWLYPPWGQHRRWDAAAALVWPMEQSP